jgi:lysozyme
MSVTDIFSQLRRDEGVRYEPYLDSRGISTVGCGHNLAANPLPGETYPLTDARVDQILKGDVARITSKLISDLPWIANLPDAIKGVCQNMSFNLGPQGLEAFHHMLADVQAGNYEQAAIAGEQSAWYQEVGDRAKRLMQQLRTQEWV